MKKDKNYDNSAYKNDDSDVEEPEVKKSFKKSARKAAEKVAEISDSTDDMSKKVITITVVGLIAIVIIVIAVSVFLGANAYKKPINDVVKGVNKADTLLLMESVYPEEIITVKRINKKNEGYTWDDYIEQSDEAIEERLDAMNLKKAKCEIVAKEKLSGSNLDEIENFYKQTYESDVQKAYRVEVNMTFKIKSGSDETPSGWVCVVKLKDEGWKFCPEYSEKHFDFIDEAIRFE